MILTRCLLTLLGIIILQASGRANFLDLSDELACIDLCTNCDGTPIFKNNVCECHVADDNQRGAECIDRIKRQAQDVGMDVVSCDLADIDADRAARCILSPLLGRSKSKNDLDLVAKYFMGDNSKGGLSSLLGSLNLPSATEDAKSSSAPADAKSSSATEDAKTGRSAPEDYKSSSASENVGAGARSDSSAPHSMIPLERIGQIPSDLLDLKPFLGAAAAWLQPSNLVAVGNGLQGIAPSAALIAQQQDPNMMSGSYGRNAMQSEQVGSPMGIYDLPSAYRAAGPVLGNISPYPYTPYLGASSPVYNQLQASHPIYNQLQASNPIYNQLQASNPFYNQLQTGSQQGYPSQSYVDNYNAMVGGANPLFGGSPYNNYANIGQQNNLEESNSADSKVVGESNPVSGVEAGKYTDSKVAANELEPVVNSKNVVEGSPEDIKDQNTKLRKSRFKSKDSYAKAEKMNGKQK